MSETLNVPRTQDLIEMLEAQRRLFAQLRTLADRQKALVVQDDARPLMNLLAQRQRLVDELVTINARLAPYRNQWTAVYSGLAEPTRRHVTELLEESNAALNTILRSDGQDSATLQARREVLVHRMGRMEQTGRAASAYGQSRRPASTMTTDERA